MFKIDRDKLKELLVEKEISKSDLARKAKMSKTQVWRILKYDSFREIKTISRICKALEVTQNQITEQIERGC